MIRRCLVVWPVPSASTLITDALLSEAISIRNDFAILLSALSNPTAAITDDNRIMFASSFMTGTAGSSWYTVVQSVRIPSTWDDFRSMVLSEFVPSDHVRRAQEKLRCLKQTASVSKYLSEFRNCILTINAISEGEKFDRFVQGLTQEIKLEVLKSQSSSFEDAAKIALRIDSSLWSSSSIRTPFTQGTATKTLCRSVISNAEQT